MSGDRRVVLGIDPGTAILGYGLLRDGARGPELIHCGALTTPAQQPQPERLQHLFRGVQELIQRFGPTEMAVERLFFAKNVATASTVGEARGVVILAGSLAGLHISEYTPLQVKQAVGGFGRASKNQMQEMVRLVLGLEVAPYPDDVADAIAVALCHLTWTQFSGVVAAATKA